MSFWVKYLLYVPKKPVYMQDLVHFLKQQTTFIFDFDGVLADSVEIKTEAFAILFQPFGDDVVQKVVAHHRQHGGVNRYDKIRHYYANYLGHELSDQELTEQAQRFSRLVVDKVVAAPEIAGASEFLNTYSAQKCCFVNSATPHAELLEILERRGWAAYFKGVFGAPTSKGKNLQQIFADYSINPDECLFFGDSTSDLAAAQGAGVPFVGVNLLPVFSQDQLDGITCKIDSFQSITS